MKRIVIGLILFLMPIVVFAEVSSTLENSATEEEPTTESQKSFRSVRVRTNVPGDTVTAKREYIQNKIAETKALKATVSALRIEKAEIRNQAKEQIQTYRTEIIALKIQMKEKFEGIKGLTRDERIALKDEIADMRSEMKEIHASALFIRQAAKDEILPIKESIKEIVTSIRPTSEEIEVINDVLEDIEI